MSAVGADAIVRPRRFTALKPSPSGVARVRASANRMPYRGVIKRKIVNSIRRRAKGYTVTEVAEEYALVDGEMTLVKRKVNKRDVPADVSAQKLYLEISGEEEKLTAAEVKREKERLLKLLEEKYGDSCGKTGQKM